MSIPCLPLCNTRYNSNSRTQSYKPQNRKIQHILFTFFPAFKNNEMMQHIQTHHSLEQLHPLQRPILTTVLTLSKLFSYSTAHVFLESYNPNPPCLSLQLAATHQLSTCSPTICYRRPYQFFLFITCSEHLLNLQSSERSLHPYQYPHGSVFHTVLLEHWFFMRGI